MTKPPEGYLGSEGRLAEGPSPRLVEAGYALELADASFLHHGLSLADLAHVLELDRIGVLTGDAAAALCQQLLEFWSTAVEDFPYDPVYGDAYNSRERELEKRLGSTAGWLPTGRTRREAGRIALRLALRDRLLGLHDVVARLASTLAARGEELADTAWNDTTYLQPAQPSSFGYYLAGFGEQAARDLERIRMCYRWVNQSPAGSGGVGGTTIPLNRKRLAASLGFDGPTAHIRDGMWSADGLIDVAVAATQAVLTVDRLAEDLEIFASPQFGYVRLAGGTARASVLLPQKRNPYSLSVIRGGAGTLIGRATGLMATQRTPSARTDNWLYAYGEVMGAVEMAIRLVGLGEEVVGTMEVDTEALKGSAGAHFSMATDLAEQMVRKGGMDYRSAYRIVSRAVAQADSEGRSWPNAEDFRQAGAEMGMENGTSQWEPRPVSQGTAEELLERRHGVGSCSPNRVLEHCRSIRRRVVNATEWAQSATARTKLAVSRLLEAASTIAER